MIHGSYAHMVNHSWSESEEKTPPQPGAHQNATMDAGMRAYAYRNVEGLLAATAVEGGDGSCGGETSCLRSSGILECHRLSSEAAAFEDAFFRRLEANLKHSSPKVNNNRTASIRFYNSFAILRS